MGDNGTDQDWLDRFPALSSLDDPAWQELLGQCRVVTLPAGIPVFRAGDPCRFYMLVLEGSVRVQTVAESGREITLYRVAEGQSCVLTTSCLMAGDTYPAEGVTETVVRAVTLPVGHFHRALAGSEGFRRFVFTAYGKRISSLIVLIEEVAFGRLALRLAQYLLRQADGDGVLHCTHQALAAELGTAREVVSRQLKDWERQGLLVLHRGRIELCDSSRLRAIA